MILQIILLVLIVLVLAMLILFLFMVLFPSIGNQTETDALVSGRESGYADTEKPSPPVSTGKKAAVLCSCERKFSNPPLRFNAGHTCSMIRSVYGTGTDCPFSCIGLGDCMRICPQSAISISSGTAVISSLCTGCGKCAEECPVGIIRLVPEGTQSLVKCVNTGNDLTSCSCRQKEEKISWNDKKDFKLWAHCYRILALIRNRKRR